MDIRRRSPAETLLSGPVIVKTPQLPAGHILHVAPTASAVMRKTGEQFCWTTPNGAGIDDSRLRYPYRNSES